MSQLKFINKIGVELEGGWLNPPGCDMHIDNSVKVIAPYVGEVSSPPMTVEEVLQWMGRRDVYPDCRDNSCGMHVHISTLNHHDLMLLATNNFWEAFLVEMKRWGVAMGLSSSHDFWQRLSGRNRFCRREFVARMQLGLVPDDGKWGVRERRYTMLNYYAFEKYGTVENRLFPMFKDMKVSLSAVKNYAKFVNGWIERYQEHDAEPLAVTLKRDRKIEKVRLERTISCS